MIDLFLEKYPVRETLPNGTPITLRPLGAEDLDAFRRFHETIPERERFLMKHRLTDPGQIEEWCRDLDFERRLPLLAFEGDNILGQATLHQRPGGWKRHIGMVDALIHPAWRGRGVLRALLGEIVEIARHGGLTRLEAEFNGDRASTILSFGRCGFVELVRLPEYLQDMKAQLHDYVLMGLDLGVDYDHTGAGD